MLSKATIVALLAASLLVAPTNGRQGRRPLDPHFAQGVAFAQRFMHYIG